MIDTKLGIGPKAWAVIHTLSGFETPENVKVDTKPWAEGPGALLTIRLANPEPRVVTAGEPDENPRHVFVGICEDEHGIRLQYWVHDPKDIWPVDLGNDVWEAANHIWGIAFWLGKEDKVPAYFEEGTPVPTTPQREMV